MGAVAVGRVLGLATGAEKKGLTSGAVDRVRGGWGHGSKSKIELRSQRTSFLIRFERVFIPIEQDAGGGVEMQLGALF